MGMTLVVQHAAREYHYAGCRHDHDDRHIA